MKLVCIIEDSNGYDFSSDIVYSFDADSKELFYDIVRKKLHLLFVGRHAQYMIEHARTNRRLSKKDKERIVVEYTATERALQTSNASELFGRRYDIESLVNMLASDIYEIVKNPQLALAISNDDITIRVFTVDEYIEFIKATP